MLARVFLEYVFGMRLISLLIVLSALAGGFAIGMMDPLVVVDHRHTSPVNLTLRFDTRQDRQRLERGWGQTETWGTPLAETSASVLVGFDGPMRGDVELLIQVESRKRIGRPQALVLRFNDAELGRWEIGNEPRQARRRFVIAKDVANADTVGRFSLEYLGPAARASNVGLVSLALRDLRPRMGKRGFVDQCDSEAIAGWAVVDNVGSAVTAKIDGEPLPHTLSTTVREDLAALGLPEDSGFVLTPKRPIPSGARIDVEFFDGRPLRKSPCQP